MKRYRTVRNPSLRLLHRRGSREGKLVFKLAPTTWAVLVLLAVILAVPAFAGSTPSVWVPGDDPITPRLAHLITMSAAERLPYVVQVFDKDTYYVDGEAYITPQVECFNRLVDRQTGKLEKVVPEDRFAIEVHVGGRGEFFEAPCILARSGSSWITVIVRVTGKPDLVWWDTCQIVVKAPGAIAGTDIMSSFDAFAPVYEELGQSIMEWRKPDYGVVPRKYDIDDAMQLAYNGNGRINGGISLGFVVMLESKVSELSHGRYFVFEPSRDEYVKLGGITCTAMQVTYLARKDKVSGEIRPFMLYANGDTDQCGRWPN